MILSGPLDPARRARRARAARLWLCATLAGLLVAIAGVPETSFRTLRATLRQHPASGRVVVVGIDDKSLAALGQWPLPRSTYARLLDRLFAEGADRVYLTPNFISPQSPAEDGAFADALRRHAPRVFLGTRFTVDDRTGTPAVQQPLGVLAKQAGSFITNFPLEPNGEAWSLPYSVGLEGRTYAGLAAQVAGKAASGFFPIDSSVDIKTIRPLNITDVLGGRRIGALNGARVIVGVTTDQVADFNVLRPYGRISNTVIQAVGAETLLAGPAANIGAYPALVFVAALVAIVLLIRNPAIRIAGYGVVAILVFTAYLTIPTGIWFSLLPGLTLLSVAFGIDGYALVTESLRLRATTNQISGLLNLTALRQLPLQSRSMLVVAQIHNFADAIATLPEDQEASLIAQIASRLKLGSNELQLFHGDNGVFSWFTHDRIEAVGDHLDGLHAMFRSPVVIDGHNIDLAVTFGVDSDDERTIANRLGSALVAATEAATDGAKWREFDKSKLADAAWKLSLLSQLDTAIDEGDLWVAYQPKLDLGDRRIIGAEALVRWTHPEKGAISPIEFVAAAEQHNRIEKLTMHVLDRAVLAAATINAHGIPFGIAVNLSTRLLETHDIVAAVTAALDAHGLPAAKLTLEITETATLSSDTSLAVLGALRDLGVRISIDDYGTGLSTLDYLKRIPACEIKIDRSFVQSIMGGGSDLLMVNSTIQLAHSLGHVVVAEGVETDEVLARLADLQCDIAQGYRIGRPMTFQDLARRLLAERRRAA